MKRLLVSLAISCACLGVAQNGQGQTEKAVVVVEPSGDVPVGLVIEKRDQLKKWTGVASAVVLETQVANQLSATDWQTLKGGLQTTAVYVIGGGSLGFVIKALGLPISVPRFPEHKVYGEGVFLSHLGTLFTDHFAANRSVNTDRLLDWVRQTTLSGRASQQRCQTKTGWKEMRGSQTVFDDTNGDGRELFQRVEFCRNDSAGGSAKAWWRVKITSETRPERDRKLRDVQTREHKKVIRVDDGLSRDCYGPGTTGTGKVATVQLNCPSKADEMSWEWNTGGTDVKQSAVSDRLQIRWDVSYVPNSAESLSSYRWLPGVQFTAGEPLRLHIENWVTWFSHGQQLPPLYGQWEPRSP